MNLGFLTLGFLLYIYLLDICFILLYIDCYYFIILYYITFLYIIVALLGPKDFFRSCYIWDIVKEPGGCSFSLVSRYHLKVLGNFRILKF